MIKIFDNRCDMIKELGIPNGVIAEIGVFKGDFSRQIIELISPSKFYLLDMFEGETCSGNADGNNVIYANMNDEHNNLNNTLGKLNSVHLLKGDSSTNLSIFPDNYFDIIYIDGDHSYTGCKRDLEMAFKKIKHDGYIMGHDYEMNMNKGQTYYVFGVRQATDEFCQNYNQKIIAKGMDGCVSYAIKVNKTYT